MEVRTLALAAWLWGVGMLAQAPPKEPTPSAPPAQKVFRASDRVRPQCPVRLGGVYTLGLGEGGAREESAARGSKLSADNQQWIAANCDLIALNAVNLTPETFPAMTKAQPLFTPLLLLSASSLYESPEARGNVGGWKPEMMAWTLRDGGGNPIPHPVQGGHWMDCGNGDWAAHWRERAAALAQQYGAQGVVAMQLPLSNLYVGGNLEKYRTADDFTKATADWLRAVHDPRRFLLIPSARGFDSVAGHPTLPTPLGTEQEHLSGRLWDDYFHLIDGAWSPEWVCSYRDLVPLPEEAWTIALEAADRAGRAGQVFIAAAAYHNDAELEYALASYLLIAHNQGRCVFQPMPLLPDERLDLGLSLGALRQQVEAKSAYFNAPLGQPIQERHLVPAEGGQVWRRAFERGVVYVNSSEKRGCSVLFGSDMERVTGVKTRKVDLPPQSGVILFYPAAR